MATVNQDAIDTFMSITGASEPVAIQRLNESGGNLNEAVNAHFSEGDVNAVQEAPVTVTAPLNDDMDIDDPPGLEARGSSSLLSATGGLNPFSLLDPGFRRGLLGTNFFDSTSELMGQTQTPIVSQPREVREIPIEVRDGHDTIIGHSGHGPRIEDVTDTIDGEGPGIRGAVILDNDDEVIPVNSQNNRVDTRPSAPEFDVDVEEEMIRAAIEASKRDAQLQNKDSSSDVGPQRCESDVAHAVSLSLSTVEQESMQGNQTSLARASGSSADMPVKAEELEIGEPYRSHRVSSFSSQDRKETGSSSILDEVDELDEQPLVRRRSSRWSSGSMEAEREVGETEAGPTLSPSGRSVSGQIHPNGNSFPSEWGGISSEEHDEAVMLEAAMFGGIPESGYQIPHPIHQHRHPVFDAAWTAPRPVSPSVVAQRAIREQQDDEYLASLQADREKEMRAMEEEKAAREAAFEEERRKEQEAQRKLEEEQELGRQLAGKQASLPEEPSLDDENAVALLIRMRDGSRHGRRFRKSDKLQSLFDFLDVGRIVKPGTYRVVRPYPRQAFSDGQCNLTLNELGLTSKQEALFLELI